MTEAEARTEFIRQVTGDSPPWWADQIAEHLQAGGQLRAEIPRRLLVQHPTGRLALVERKPEP